MKIILSLIIFLVLAAAGYNFITKSPIIEQKKESLRIFPGPGPAASLFQIADKKGFFENEGLDVTLQSYENGPQSILALQQDKLDVAHPAEYAFVTQTFNEKNKNLRILGSVIRWSGIEIVARKDHGIQKPTDIAGKKVGLALGTQSEFVLADFMTKNQIPSDQVLLIDLKTRQEAANAITNGEVDAIVNSNQFVYETKKKLGSNAVSWWLQDVSSYPLLITTKDKIEKNPQVFEKLFRAMEKSINYANANPEETKKAGIEAYGFEEEFLEFFWERIRFEMSLSQELLLVMENQARWMINRNLVNATKTPNYLNYIYPNALDNIKPEAVTIIR